MGYYSTAASMLEQTLPSLNKGKGKALDTPEGEKEEEERAMCVRCLVAMIEIWMSDLWYVDLTDLPEPKKCRLIRL